MSGVVKRMLYFPPLCAKTSPLLSFHLKKFSFWLTNSRHLKELHCGCASKYQYQSRKVTKFCLNISAPISQSHLYLNISLFHSSSRHDLQFPKLPVLRKKDANSKPVKKKKGKKRWHTIEMRAHSDVLEMTASERRDRETFLKAVALFKGREGHYKRGAVEFVHGAMQQVKAFGVHRDLACYKQLMSCFQQGKYVARGFWENEIMYYPQEQTTAITMLDIAERFGVMPDEEMGEIIMTRFGDQSHVMRKYYRQMYWMPKFRNTSPYFKGPPSKDLALLAQYVMRRICVDSQTEISMSKVREEGEEQSTFIVSGQSPAQQQLLEEHAGGALVLEGAHHTWLQQSCWSYFVLRADVTPRFRHFDEHGDQPEEDDFSFEFSTLFTEARPQSEVAVPPSEHEQADGTVVALAITSTASKASLAAWLKQLEASNPRLAQLPVYFKLRQPHPVPVWHADTELSPERQREVFPEAFPAEVEEEEVEEMYEDGEWRGGGTDGPADQDGADQPSHSHTDSSTETGQRTSEHKQEKSF